MLKPSAWGWCPWLFSWQQCLSFKQQELYSRRWRPLAHQLLSSISASGRLDFLSPTASNIHSTCDSCLEGQASLRAAVQIQSSIQWVVKTTWRCCKDCPFVLVHLSFHWRKMTRFMNLPNWYCGLLAVSYDVQVFPPSSTLNPSFSLGIPSICSTLK